MSSSSDVSSNNISEEKIREEHRTWKKSAPLLYDFVIATQLLWPTPVVQWLPLYETNDSLVQRLIIGTRTDNTKDEKTYVEIKEVRLPPDNEEEDKKVNEQIKEENDEENKEGNNTKNKEENSTRNRKQTMKCKKPYGKIETIQKILHEGDVNRCRYMPQNSDILATKPNNDKVYVFDRKISCCCIEEKTSDLFQPTLVLSGHADEGFGLNWSPHEEGRLLSSDSESYICYWDIQQTDKDKLLQPLHTFLKQEGSVNDVTFSCFEKDVFASAADDGTVAIWDCRDCDKVPVLFTHADNSSVQGISYSPSQSHHLLSCGEDKSVALWDLRNFTKRAHSFESHENMVLNVCWSPFDPTIFASCSRDRRVNIWDTSKIGNEQNQEDADDGPPELVFVHAGHCGSVEDINWNMNDDWMMASVDDSNILQVWKVSENIWKEDNENDIDESLLE